LALLTQQDLRRQSVFTWLCLGALGLVIVWLWSIDRRNAAIGTAAALVGCLALILPPRERMAVLPWRLRALPRRLDAAPVLATLLSSPGYGLNYFHGVNPYDEIVHLLSGVLAGAVFAGLLLTDGLQRRPGRMALAGLGFGLALGVGWEVFEWAIAIIGDARDTISDVLLTAAGAAGGAALWQRYGTAR
jgi:hypothetical protein